MVHDKSTGSSRKSKRGDSDFKSDFFKSTKSSRRTEEYDDNNDNAELERRDRQKRRKEKRSRVERGDSPETKRFTFKEPDPVTIITKEEIILIKQGPTPRDLLLEKIKANPEYLDTLLPKEEVPGDPLPSSQNCPFLGTINKHYLDFDFEKLCSVTLSNQHVYCCLVCGHYFQGRGKGTVCYTHALEENHFVYINLSDCKVYCLPENYLIEDASLDDIRYFLKPSYKPEYVSAINTNLIYAKALDGTDFMPGYIGLNNLKKTDFFNVIIQLLCKVTPLRNHLLLLDLSHIQSPDPVLLSLSDLVKKIFNPKNFKGIVSPHEFLQVVGVASAKKFKIGEPGDPLALLNWLLQRIHQKMKRRGNSVVYDSFQGEILISTEKGGQNNNRPVEEIKPFMHLAICLPDAPIFKDSLDRNMIPHVPIFSLLTKFDGQTPNEPSPGVVQRLSLWRLPKYLVFHVKRFSKNNFFVEKNPTIVTFPVKSLDLADYVHPDAVDNNPVCKYNLIANVCHQGKPTEGIYKVHILHAAGNEWFEVEDLRVTPVLPQFVALSESYVQLFQRQDVLPTGELDEAMIDAARAARQAQQKDDPDVLLMDDIDDIFAKE